MAGMEDENWMGAEISEIKLKESDRSLSKVNCMKLIH